MGIKYLFVNREKFKPEKQIQVIEYYSAITKSC